MPDITRRTALATTAAAAGALALPSPALAAPHQVHRGRPRLTSGVSSGDVTTDSAVVWARADRPSRMVATLTGRGRSRRTIRGPWVTPGTDHTGKIDLRHLAPGRRHEIEVAFEDEHGRRGESTDLSFTTADRGRGSQSFVWTGDTAGQGWGINPDLGGYVAYRAMHATRPDFFIHCGDTIYADGPIEASVTEPDGQVWRNLVIPEVSEVAQTLAEFRGRHRYNHLDDNLRAMYADVPVIAQWDDHETTNNWYPGEVLEDPRYDRERRVDVLARHAKRAWWEWQPISNGQDRRDGQRIHRKVSRGRHLDVFCLDMRTFKDPNTPGLEQRRTSLIGDEQVRWLARELKRSTATWKVISADLPLGIVVPDGDAQESLANADDGAPLGKEIELAWLLREIKHVPGVVWITADVHYCAAHHYSPERAAFTDFAPFWEFVAGPINAGTFGPNEMDGTFGPRVDFVKSADHPNQSPRGGNQFFGHADIADDGTLTVTLRDAQGTVLYTRELSPER
ncbi:alkaline phosphatase D family protein [Janibacter hoylei]|uniref:alkaline phosphatase D family protein n=1 Tax=Janibacter hoylei TaxID=364298 RepID=UPI002492FBF3|nr:alkaline phosphatase D family protein [Janibacter hoylei]